MQTYQPLSLLSFGNGTEPFRSSLSRRKPIAFVTEKSSFSVRPVARPVDERTAERSYIVEIESAGERVDLYFVQKQLDLLVARREPGLEFDEIPAAARAIVLEFILEDVVRFFENLLGVKHSITQCKILKQQMYEPNAFFEVSAEGLSLLVTGHFADRQLERLWHWSLSLPKDRPINLNSEIAIRCGTAALTMSQLKSLRIGDGIVISVGTDEEWFAVVGEKFLAPLLRRNGAFELLGPLLVEPSGPMRQMMDSELNGDELGEISSVGGVGDIPIKVVFNAGRLTVPMSELDEISVGHIFEVESSEESSIEIIAQGVVIGRGKLISVNGLTAVQVTAINSR